MGHDRNQILNDPETSLQLALDGRQSIMWTALPCVVQKIDFTKMTLECQPAIQGQIEDENGKIQNVNLPMLLDVPICFPSCSGFLITLPLAIGDEVLVVFASRCIDSWWQSGQTGGITTKAAEFRMHDLSDGFAIPGPRSIPNVAPAISATDLEIRNKAGTTYLSITAGGKIGFANTTTDLKTVLTDLNNLLSTFMTVLAGFSGGGSPVSQAMLQAPAAAAETSLIATLAEIGALLK